MPILWHIMKIYDHFGFQNFVIALGYKGEYIKRYMVDYCSLSSDLTVDMGNGEVTTHGSNAPSWSVELIDTGQSTNTGGRIKRLAPYLNRETFLLTWGDGVSDLDIRRLLAFHRAHGRHCTLTAVRPPARFGALDLTEAGRVTRFTEKPQIGEGWINGAFFVCEPQVLDYIEGDDTLFEREPLERLAADGQLMAYRHTGFWQCMDTLRDKYLLNRLWNEGDAPWQVWREQSTTPVQARLG